MAVSPRAFVSFLVSLVCFLFAGAQLDARAEADRVNGRLRHVAEVVGRDTTSFWSDSAQGRVLAVLQDRVQQVVSFVGSCRSALSLVHKARFPLDEQPQGLGALMARFRNGEAAREFVRAQLVSGATNALAFVRRRHPYMCLTGIEEIPPRPDGEPTPMEAHYPAVEGVAVNLIGKLEHDTELQLDHVALQVPKTEPKD